MNIAVGRTAEQGLGFRDDDLDMHRRLLCFGSKIATRSYHRKRIRLAIRVLEIEPAEENGRCRDYPLSKLQLLAQLCYHYHTSSLFEVPQDNGARTISKVYRQVVQVLRIISELDVFSPCLV